MTGRPCACCGHFESFGKDGLCLHCREASGLTNRSHEHPWLPQTERRIEDLLLQAGTEGVL